MLLFVKKANNNETKMRFVRIFPTRVQIVFMGFFSFGDGVYLGLYKGNPRSVYGPLERSSCEQNPFFLCGTNILNKERTQLGIVTVKSIGRRLITQQFDISLEAQKSQS